MQRWLVRILICLALGAMTTVGVAWGCVRFYSGPSLPLVAWTGPTERRDEPVWFFTTTGGLGMDLIEMSPRTLVLIGYSGPDLRELPLWSRLQRPPTDGDVKNQVQVTEVAAGWPSRSNFLRIHRNGATGATTLHGGIAFGRRIGDRSTMPLSPIWQGLLIDTLFYGVIWFGLIFGFGAMRRRLRKKRGLCPMCGYDLRGGVPQAGRLCHRIQGCPECGWNR